MAATATIGACGVVAAVGLWSTPALADDDLQQFRAPSAQMLAGSVFQWSVKGSVTSLRTSTVRNGKALVSVSSDVLFAFGSATPAKDAATVLKTTLDRVPKSSTVDVDGYTDSIGTDAANLVLSQRRAAAIAAVVRSARPDVTVVAKGHGEANPVAPNGTPTSDNPAGRALNRRVTLSYTA